MRFTTYGKSVADPGRQGPETGATAHMLACQHNTGQRVILTGHDFAGKPIRREAASVSGAYFTMVAVAGLERAWHVLPDGKRKLVMTR